MKLNRILTKQTLKELVKSITNMADLIEEESLGIECKSIKVEKTEKEDSYQMEINIKLDFIDTDISNAEELLEKLR